MDRKCSVTDCSLVHSCGGYCQSHYDKFRRTGTVLGSPKEKSFCSVNDCDKKHYGKGLCAMHWHRVYRNGDPLLLKRRSPLTGTLEERFFKSFDINNENGCWEWNQYVSSRAGYGALGIKDPIKGRTLLVASRVSYEIHKGPIPEGLYVCHSCDNPPCVNPDHLFLGTNQDNINDMVSKDRSFFGERNNLSKLKETQVVEIKNKLKNRVSIENLSQEYNVCEITIIRIRDEETWIRVKGESC